MTNFIRQKWDHKELHYMTIMSLSKRFCCFPIVTCVVITAAVQYYRNYTASKKK